MIEIKPGLSLPDDELRFTFSRSGGPGGQNVNKVSSKATLWFNVVESPTLSEMQKQKLLQRLGNRISKDGVLQIVSAQFRTQKANREDALQRFATLLSAALHEQRVRKKTRVPRRVKETRLKSKKRKGMLKASRVKKWDE